MSRPNREWLATFTPEVLSDLRAAARAFHAEIDDCDPEACAHSEPKMYATDLPDWIERHVKQLEAEEVAKARIIPEKVWRGVRSHEPAGRPGRREANLAATA